MRRSLLLTMVFIINSCALIYEVVASRKAATYIGATAYANSLLLSSFLAGIGFGGWAASHHSFQSRLTQVCGALLVLGGVAAALLSPGIAWLTDAGPQAIFVRALVLAAWVMPVGLGVGFSFPAITALYSTAALGRGAASTYAADALGAAIGSIASGFVLIPMLGLRTTGIFAGIGLACVAGVLLLYPTGSLPRGSAGRFSSGSLSFNTRLVLGLFVTTGFAALAFEVVWIRLYTLVIGTSIFSFALTVGSFLAALGLGSHTVRSRVDSIRDPAAVLSRIMVLTGASGSALLLLAPVWERIYLAAYRTTGSVALLQITLLALGLISILIPAGLMGAGFSLGVRLVNSAHTGAAGPVGRLYGLNTLGGVLGALTSGLILLPAIGLRGTVLVSAFIYLLAGSVLSLRLADARSRLLTHALTGGSFLLLLIIWIAPEPGFFFASYYHGLRFDSYEDFAAARGRQRLLYRRFSPYGVVTASQDDQYRYLRHNGRSEASTSPTDMSTQLLIAHVPMLMHPAPRRVLNIGLGAGFTLGAITQHPGCQSIVQAEIDPRIVEAARLHFADVNADALQDPRVLVTVTDGRKLLSEQSARFDVIVSEPSHLWVSGVSGLFTSEFYHTVAERLEPGGIFATWVPRYEMAPGDIQIVAATLLTELPHVSAFENGPADIILIASKSPFVPTPERVNAALGVTGIRNDIARAMQGFPLTAENLLSLLSQVAANADAMAQAVPADTPLNTDDWPVLEFHTALAAISKRGPPAAQSP